MAVIYSRKFCDELISCVSNVADDHLAVNAFQTILQRMQFRNIAFESQVTISNTYPTVVVGRLA